MRALTLYTATDSCIVNEGHALALHATLHFSDILLCTVDKLLLKSWGSSHIFQFFFFFCLTLNLNWCRKFGVSRIKTEFWDDDEIIAQLFCCYILKALYLIFRPSHK